MGPLRSRKTNQIIFATIIACGLLSAAKADVTWNPAVQNGSWSIGSNWLGGMSPTESESISIIFDDALQHTVVADMQIPQMGTLTFSAQLSGPATLQINNNSNLSAPDFFHVTGNGGATVHQSDGTLSTRWLNIGSTASSSAGYFLSGGTLIATTAIDVGKYGNGSLVQSGGTINTNFLVVGGGGVNGTYLISDGVLNAEFLNVGNTNGRGTVIQSGGTVTVASSSYPSLGMYGNYQLQGGTLITRYESWIGTFTQSGGFHRTRDSSGNRFTISGGILAVDKRLSGFFITQTGGLVALGSKSAAGALGPDVGKYVLSGGTLEVFGTERLSTPLAGQIVQSGGVHLLGDSTHAGLLQIGAKPGYQGAIPSYQLSGGTFTAFGTEEVSFTTTDGTGGFGKFIQTGGYHSLGGTINVGVGGQAGTYELSGGEASLTNVNVGSATGMGTVIVSGGTLSVPGTMQLTPNSSFTLSGGTARVGSLNLAGRLKMTAGATLSMAIGNLSIVGNGVLDLSDNQLELTYQADSPIDTIVGYLQAGYNHGHWNGTGGITSTSAAGDESGAVAYQDNGTSIFLTYSFAGDSNLDGRVDIADLYNLASNWQSSSLWQGGDFNYDRIVDSADLALLARNWQAGAAAPVAIPLAEILSSLDLPAAIVPEPSVMGIAILLAPYSLRRRFLHRRT